MIYHGTSFNVEWVKTLTKKQFQHRGGIGNELTQTQLAEAYDLITGNKDENDRKHAKKFKQIRRAI